MWESADQADQEGRPIRPYLRFVRFRLMSNVRLASIMIHLETKTAVGLTDPANRFQLILRALTQPIHPDHIRLAPVLTRLIRPDQAASPSVQTALTMIMTLRLTIRLTLLATDLMIMMNTTRQEEAHIRLDPIQLGLTQPDPALAALLVPSH